MDKGVMLKPENPSENEGDGNSDRKERGYLYPDEVNRLLAVSKQERYSRLWYCFFLLMYRHAYRVSELIKLQWKDINFYSGQISVNRIKNSNSGVHPLGADEIKALKVLYKAKSSNYVFISSQQKPLTRESSNYAIARIAKKAKIEINVHPHILRHSAAIHFLEKTKDLFLTQQFLGHKDMKNTLLYLKLTPGRLEEVKDWYR